MKILLKLLAVVVALTGISVYVWNANRQQQANVEAAPAENIASPAIVEEPKVTDAEVEAARDTMLRSSKSGMIMSVEDTRAMLEERKRQEKQPQAGDLVPSSKSIRILSPEESAELEKMSRETIEKQLQQRRDEQQSKP